MANKIAVEIVSADRTIYSGEGELISATASTGEVGIMHGHTPLLASLKPGHVTISHEDQEDNMSFISGGFIEVQPNKVTILADTAERAEDLAEAAAQEAVDQAKESVRNAPQGADLEKAQRILAESEARMSLLKRFQNRK